MAFSPRPVSAETLFTRRAEKAEAQLGQLQQINALRSNVILGLVIDGIVFLTGAADSGDPDAKQTLKQFADAMDKARAVTSGIVLPAPTAV